MLDLVELEQLRWGHVDYRFGVSGGRGCYGEKLPMAWGVPQQTTRHQKSIFPNMQEKPNI